MIAILAMWFSEKDFVAIAADAGGVATGPLANSLAADLNDVGRGIAFVLPVNKIAGVAHFLNQRAK